MNDLYRNVEKYPDPTAGAALTRIVREEKERRRQTADGYRPLVYISSPYAGDVDRNVRDAIQYCRFAVEMGCIPFAAHLHFPQILRDDDPAERKLGLDMALVMLDRCRCLWVFGDRMSSGMEQEYKRAMQRGYPIRWFTAGCREMPDREAWEAEGWDHER